MGVGSNIVDEASIIDKANIGALKFKTRFFIPKVMLAITKLRKAFGIALILII